MGTLTVTFSGICTHFFNCITPPGGTTIPMRSVLPNALGVHFGMVQRPATNDPVQPMYYLMPHVAVIADAAKTTPPPDLFSYLYGAKLEVLNPDPDPLKAFKFDSSLANGYHLPDFVDPDPGIQPSRDVVQDNNAACYFDFYFGTGSVVQVKGGTSLTTVVTIDTIKMDPFPDDTPIVRITPFPGSLMVDPKTGAQAPFVWTVTNGTLFVSNQDFDAGSEDKDFDFMLNYLTTFPGIPRFLKKNVPGMTDPLTQLTPPVLSDKMTELSTAISSLGPTFPFPGKEMSSIVQLLASRVLNNVDVELDASCSDSHYP